MRIGVMAVWTWWLSWRPQPCRSAPSARCRASPPPAPRRRPRATGGRRRAARRRRHRSTRASARRCFMRWWRCSTSQRSRCCCCATRTRCAAAACRGGAHARVLRRSAWRCRLWRGRLCAATSCGSAHKIVRVHPPVSQNRDVYAHLHAPWCDLPIRVGDKGARPHYLPGGGRAAGSWGSSACCVPCCCPLAPSERPPGPALPPQPTCWRSWISLRATGTACWAWSRACWCCTRMCCCPVRRRHCGMVLLLLVCAGSADDASSCARPPAPLHLTSPPTHPPTNAPQARASRRPPSASARPGWRSGWRSRAAATTRRSRAR